MDGSILETSQDSLSSLSNCSVSPHNNHTGKHPSNFTNGLLLLRSPGPEDFKKKKGWSSSTKRQKSISSSQESKTELSSTPVNAEKGAQACEGLPKIEPFPDDDDAISFSPLSEFPAETEVKISGCRKALFGNDASENEHSTLLFSDSLSSEDELLTQFIDNLETNNVQVEESASSNTQLESVTSLLPTNQQEACGSSTCGISPCKTSIQSPQSIVLERLRETLLSSDSLHFKNLNDSSIQSEQPHATCPQVPSSQTSTVKRSQTMPPQKGQSKAGQASCLKQTDIGVFFGLKPLKEKEKEKEIESGPNELNSSAIPTLGENSGQRRQRRDRQRKSKADTTAGTSQGTATVDNSNAVDAQGEAGKGRTSGWRRRWNRRNADGEVVLPRCPFYKKIPGQRVTIHHIL